MKRTVLGAMMGAWLVSSTAFGQMPQGYLGVLTIDVKPDKVDQEIALVRKLVDVSRKNNGATWVALADVYGEHGTFHYVFDYPNYAGIEDQEKTFMAAMSKALGPTGVQKIFQELAACTLTEQEELRVRRPDLSVNLPAEAAALARLIGRARWARTTAVHVRVGRTLEFEAQALENKTAEEKATPNVPVLVSQAVAGQHGSVYYFTTFVDSLAALDKIPSLRSDLGEEGWRKFLQNAAETVSGFETAIRRIDPSISNPPDEIASVAPDFWRPKPPAAPKAKAAPKPVGNEKK